MPRPRPFAQHLKNAEALHTTYEQVRAGFVALALERNRRATPFVAEARALNVAIATIKKPADLPRMTELRSSILTAAGVSDKAAGHLDEQDKSEAIHGLIEGYLEPAGAAWKEELLFRFLLTRGDTLGGSMRNVGGALAQRRLTRAIIASLKLAATPYRWLPTNGKEWLVPEGDDSDIEIRLRGIAWQAGRRKRSLVYNLTVPFFAKSVDLVCFDCSPEELLTALGDRTRYLALGELKGGIDPAGADEHWKTASKALSRIRSSFAEKELAPAIFFVGAAIERAMAAEIWQELQDGTLANAANLTDPDQIASLCRWLVNL